GKDGTVRYEEGLLVGYRWFDTKNIEPLFPFGYGLSYTRFEYSDLRLTPGEDGKEGSLTGEFEVKNTRARAGAEVLQRDVQDLKPRWARPVKELKGFRKVFLKAGEKQTVSIPLERNAFAFYDPEKHGWAAEKGDFKILIGASSRDIRLQGNTSLKQT